MIGNDIVDLELAARESNFMRPGLQEKVLTEAERYVIRTSKFPEEQFWLFWTMKEAVYKAHQRRFNLSRKFNPKEFKCSCKVSMDFRISGTVYIQNFKYSTDAKLSEGFIHCLATASPSEEIKFKIFSEKTALKKALISSFSRLHRLQSEDVEILKHPNGIPQLLYCGKHKRHAFSLSHHGRFSAFAYAVN
ncbi:4'-phosphopantetheinyl transferase superfamily protein [Zunongwangia sp. H14]|uniref:4'-phosphopantetheinyl transferase family protein n=1 Tax=Zunongwangia sp. H14 TaxID=3240792 RepID=UPI00356ADDAE